jgi:hypothetical protein
MIAGVVDTNPVAIEEWLDNPSVDHLKNTTGKPACGAD